MTTARTATRAPRGQEPARPKSQGRPRGSEGRRAAKQVGERSVTRLEVPVLGSVALPSRDQLVFFGGLGALVVVGMIEWPVAAVVGTGHLLAAKRNNRALRDFGEALEQA
jgi:hypothetical protein